MPHLQFFNADDIEKLVNIRSGEIKIGEKVQLPLNQDLENTLSNTIAKFVIIGIPEDIGVRANGGIGGTETAWNSFIKSFLNIQETPALSGTDILILGHINFEDFIKESEKETPDELRIRTEKIDDIVFPIIRSIVAAGKIPIIIGGGHNNAFPLIKGTSLAKASPINTINLDAHSDFRNIEGRHSGNGFRYAYDAGFLKKYALLGLHEAYNSTNIVKELMGNKDLFPIFWEDIFLRNKLNWPDAIRETILFVQDVPFGVELDVDCIENVLSSAATPVGIRTQQAVQYLYSCGLSKNAAYLHLPEGITKRADGQENIFTGKLLNYLVQAFCKGVLEKA